MGTRKTAAASPSIAPPTPLARRSGATLGGPVAFQRAVVVLGLTLALVVALLVPTDEDRAPKPTDASLFPSTLLVQSPMGERAVFSARAGYAFGRWKQPQRTLAFHTDRDWTRRLRALFTTKHWHYSSVDSERFFVGAAVVSLGYASDAFVYVVDKTSPEMEKFEFTGRLPGSMGLTFAGSSIDDQTCTSFTSLGSESLSFCYDSQSSEWVFTANVTTVGAIHGDARRFTAKLFLKREEALTLLFPVGNDTMRPAYVHKGAGSPVHGSFELGDVSVQLNKSDQALGAIDWTRSLALRCTRWNWASSSFRARVTTTAPGQSSKTAEASVGINFSKDVYDINGESQENAVWIDGKVHVLRGVAFTVPTTSPTQEKWLVTSVPKAQATGKEHVELEFTPSGGSREDHTHLLVVESDFVQPYGTFSGKIVFEDPVGTHVAIEVVDAFGVVEDHLALW